MACQRRNKPKTTNHTFLLKQVLSEFSSIMTSSTPWCEIFSTGSYKWSSFALDGFSSTYKDLHAKGTGSFCGQMKLILCTRHPPQGGIIAQVIREIPLTSMHVRKGRVAPQDIWFGSAVTLTMWAAQPVRAPSAALRQTVRAVAGDANANAINFSEYQMFVFSVFCISQDANTVEKNQTSHLDGDWNLKFPQI